MKTHVLPYQDPIEYLKPLQHHDHLIFFDSVAGPSEMARYSFIAWDPFATLVATEEQVVYTSNGQQDFFYGRKRLEILSEKIKSFTLNLPKKAPPFCGGVAGFLSYDLGRDLETLPTLAAADVPYPQLALGFYDVVLTFDHVEKQAVLFSSGFPEMNSLLRAQRATVRLEAAVAALSAGRQEDRLSVPKERNNERQKDNQRSILAVKSPFSKASYIEAVNRAKQYILDGDIFEVNLSQRFAAHLPPSCAPFALYQRLRQQNPAPFSAWFHFGDLYLLSTSPERFLKQGRDGQVEARPIKGTRKRSKAPLEDAALAQALLSSAKDRAENTMIVDLMRNDLSKVCVPSSVKVPQYCALESYETVHHLVSVVTGRLRPGMNAIDLLKATFPGGSITGAPKIRAMEIIDEIEPTRRGPYCGSLLYLGFDGAMDASILIRTVVIQGSTVSFQGGGAVVMDSDPAQEYEETLQKTRVLRDCLVAVLGE